MNEVSKLLYDSPEAVLVSIPAYNFQYRQSVSQLALMLISL